MTGAKQQQDHDNDPGAFAAKKFFHVQEGDASKLNNQIRHGFKFIFYFAACKNFICSDFVK
jgi:hypothetical protein